MDLAVKSAANREPEVPVPDYRALFESAPGLFLVVEAYGPNFRMVAVSDAYLQATKKSREEIVGRGLFQVFAKGGNPIHAAALQNLRSSFERVMVTRKPDSMPVQRYDIDGLEADGGTSEERYWNIVNAPVPGDTGEVRFIINRVEDVTALVRSKRREAEALFSRAFAEAPLGMVLTTPEGLIAEANQAYLDMLGYGHEDLASQDSAHFTHPDDIEPTRQFFASFRDLTRTTATIEKRYLRKEGQILWVRVSATMLRDSQGMPTQLVAIVEDITERKRAEERLRFLAESIPQMVWTATPDGMLDYVNRQGTEYFGVPQTALHGAGWLAGVHPEEQDRAVARWQESLITKEPYETAFRLRRASDASWRWHLVRALPLLGEDGSLLQWFGTCTDIEDQKQAEANLQQQWHTFDTALSHTPDFTYIFDLDGRFKYVNRALLSLWEKPLEEALGKNFFDLGYPVELGARLQRQIRQVIESKQPLRDHTPFAGPTGEMGYYEYIFVPVLDANGVVEAVAGSTRDLTEQMRGAQQIENDRRRWRELLLQTPAAIAVLRGPVHTFEWVNSEYVRLVGRPAEDLVGKTIREALPEVEGQIYVNLLNEVYRTGESFTGRESPVRLDRGDGTLQDVYVNFSYQATRDSAGDIDGIFATVTDVTDMVAARKQVEESERQFRTLAETIPHLAWMADETGFIFWYNRRWYEYTGTTLQEMEGWGWQETHDPEVLPSVLAQWSGAILSGEPFEMVFPLKGADGRFRPFLTRVEPVKDNDGRVVRWFGTNTDITDQRRIEEALRRTNRELEEFAYVASHDLQEPLRMVNIYTHQILKSIGAGDEKLSLYSGFVHQGVARMEALIHDLLTFSRTVHTDDLPVGTADLSKSMSEALALLTNRIEEAGAVITVDPLPSARGDTAQIAHVFQNLLSNALKYRKNETRPEIQIFARRDRDCWIVCVRDNGIGFEPQYAERIFGLFKRLHRESEYPGTGLGLAICKRIVERYGGRIWADSKPNEGATFSFSLPSVEGQ